MARSDGRVEAGQNLKTAFSAHAWNRAQDAADIVLGARGGVQGGPQQAGQLPYTWCLAKNASGSDVPRWGVLAITGMEIEPTSEAGGATAEFERLPVVTGDTPSDGDTAWCVAVEPIADGKVGRVAVAGVVQAKVDIDDEDDEFVKVGDSVDELVTGTEGQGAILWKQDGTGTGKWALIRFGAGAGGGETQFKLGKTTSVWNKNNEYSLRIHDIQTGNVLSPNEFQQASNLFGTIAGAKWVLIAQVGPRWYPVIAEC
jgi:hypothetical protein